MNADRINEIVRACCCQFRKGQEVTTEQRAGLEVTHVYAMPSVDDAKPEIEKVDVHFFVVGVDRAKADEHKVELSALLSEWERLKAGPSYIETGAELGDQGAALCLYGLGEVLGFWKVITPAKLRITGPDADMAAGNGFIMCSGFKPMEAA